LKQILMPLIQFTLSVLFTCLSLLFSSLPYLYSIGFTYLCCSFCSLIYSTLFLHSLLCLFGPEGRLCIWPCPRLVHIPHQTQRSGGITGTSNSSGRHYKHHRMSTSSYFASLSHVLTSSTYFENEFNQLTDLPLSRRRESSRSQQYQQQIPLITSELIELYSSPRTSLSPHQQYRYSRQSSSISTRGLSITQPRPLYVHTSHSVSPHSHSHSSSRQRSPSPQIISIMQHRQSTRSPSPRSLITNVSLLRPCASAPRLHVPSLSYVPKSTIIECVDNGGDSNGEGTKIKTRLLTTQTQQVHYTKKHHEHDDLDENDITVITSMDDNNIEKKMIRQNAFSTISSIDSMMTSVVEQNIVNNTNVTTSSRRAVLKTDSSPIWIKRSNSS
ncbi:unnamed protein product, partial [Didymodactylos carnosus]